MAKARERQWQEGPYARFSFCAAVVVLLCLFVPTFFLGLPGDTEAGGASPKAAPYEPRDGEAVTRVESEQRASSRHVIGQAPDPQQAPDARVIASEAPASPADTDVRGERKVPGTTGEDASSNRPEVSPVLEVAADGPLRHVRPEDMRGGAQQSPVQPSGQRGHRAGATSDGTPDGGEHSGNAATAEDGEGQGVEAARPSRDASARGQSSASSTAATGVRLFGTIEFRGQLKALPKWSRVVETERKKPGLYLDRALGGKGGQVWRELRGEWQGLPLMERLKKVNTFFNQWPYRLDSENYGLPDYWATPDEFLRKSGDCEDYSIIKYFALKQLGVSADSMRIVVLLDKIRGIAHAVLAVYDGNTAYILDNLSGLVLAHDFYKHYVPQYSVNESYRWAHIPLGKKAGRK